ncbi:MAG: DUF1489 family protein [Methyloligellaceae bacterium]
MTVNLVKLCVGVETPSVLGEFIARRIKAAKDSGIAPRVSHITRMSPKRRDELLNGGSLYWVMKGSIQARQLLIDVVDFTDDEGVKRCELVLKPELVLTAVQPRKAFQGWRYLPVEDAPSDLSQSVVTDKIDPKMLSELSELGLL